VQWIAKTALLANTAKKSVLFNKAVLPMHHNSANIAQLGIILVLPVLPV
jgi:hypothetical protein